MAWALALALRGPRYVSSKADKRESDALTELISVAGAVLILPSDWRQAWLRLGSRRCRESTCENGFAARRRWCCYRARTALFEFRNGRKAENPVVERYSGCFFALRIREWRWGLLLCVVTAILQDPLRKITPDQPVFFVLFVGIVFAGACLGAVARGVPLTPSSVFGAYRQIGAPM